MLKNAEITALVEVSDGAGPMRGKLLGKASPPLVGLALYISATTADDRPLRLLFDTSTTWPNLLHNARVAGVDLRALDAVVISHWHFDHTGGLPGLLRHIGRRVPVYAPPLTQPFDPLKLGISWRLPRSADVRICPEPEVIADGVRTTGSKTVSFPRWPLEIAEHGLSVAVQGRPPAVVVGCSHAPLEWLVSQAVGEGELGWLVGGFHFISPTTEERKRQIIAFLRRRAPKALSAMHCTGKAGSARLERELPESYVPFGLGDRRSV